MVEIQNNLYLILVFYSLKIIAEYTASGSFPAWTNLIDFSVEHFNLSYFLPYFILSYSLPTSYYLVTFVLLHSYLVTFSPTPYLELLSSCSILIYLVTFSLLDA